MRYFFTLLLSIIGAHNSANGQNFQWAKQIGGSVVQTCFSIAVDDTGNVYTIGHFDGTADFDPGTGIYNLTSAGSFDIFISKMDVSGNFIWTKQVGGTGFDFGRSVFLDNTGSIYITGHFNNTVDFDPGPGRFLLTSCGTSDIYIEKLDNSGNFIWAEKTGSTGNDQGRDIVVGINGNIYVTGYFSDIIDADPGPGIYNMTSAGSYDNFVTKLDPSGSFLWSKQIGGSGSDFSFSVAVDVNENVYTTGGFDGTVDFDPGIGIFYLNAVGSSDIFVSKFNASGNFIWAKQMGGTSSGDVGQSIAVDINGSVYTTGVFMNTADFDPGTGTYNLISAGARDIFVSRLDSSGVFMWADRIGGPNEDYSSSVVVDDGGNVYSTGHIDYVLYISKTDSSGISTMTTLISGSGGLAGHAMTIDTVGNIFTTGYFSGTVDFDPGTGLYNITSTTQSDVFVLKLSDIPSAIMESNFSFNETYVYPNPTMGKINITGSGIIDMIIITNALGQIIYEDKPGKEKVTVQIDNAGIYFVQIISGNQAITKKAIVKKF